MNILGDETLKTITCELVETVRPNVPIDWRVREGVRGKLNVPREAFHLRADPQYLWAGLQFR